MQKMTIHDELKVYATHYTATISVHQYFLSLITIPVKYTG